MPRLSVLNSGAHPVIKSSGIARATNGPLHTPCMPTKYKPSMYDQLPSRRLKNAYDSSRVFYLECCSTSNQLQSRKWVFCPRVKHTNLNKNLIQNISQVCTSVDVHQSGSGGRLPSFSCGYPRSAAPPKPAKPPPIDENWPSLLYWPSY